VRGLARRVWVVSVLFSEPKIPQFYPDAPIRCTVRRFSALQRAENSSIFRADSTLVWRFRFSALQRAENSSIRDRLPELIARLGFQCSSASRKFLN